MILVVVDFPPIAFPPIASLLSPLDAAVPKHLLVASHDKYNSPGKPRKSLGRDNSPIVSSSGFKHVMDAAALFKIVDASPPRGSPLVQSYRSPLCSLENVQAVERQNPKSPLRNFQSSSLIID